MGHKRQGKPRRRADLDVGSVLAGRVRVDVEDLLDLIDAANPTGKDLPAAEARRRYAEKSALQSLLIRICPDAVIVEADPDSEGLVLLRHRFSGRDACHAIIDDLETDARSWVRLQLDIADDGEPMAPAAPRTKAAPVAVHASAPAEDRPSDSASLVRRGRELMEEYDYEEARACLEEAVRDTDGAVDAALALLELLVDHLAAYDDALAIAAGLPKISTNDRGVRVLLALAAARAGRLDDAERIMPGLGDPRLAEVRLALAGAAIREQRFPMAREHLARARELDPGDAGLAARERDLAQAEAAALADDERALEVVRAREDETTTEARAEDLLRRWPGSKVGRRILAEIGGRRRAAELEAVEQQAEEASARGALDEAIALWRRAITLGGDTAAVQGKIAAAEAEARRREDGSRVSEVLRLLDGADPDAGLGAYWHLNRRLQDAVRDVRPLPELAWLSAIIVEEPGNTGRDRAVAAVRDLARAVELHGAGQIEAAARLLAPHAGPLAAIPEARSILDDERERQVEIRRSAALAALGAAQDALDRGDAGAARRGLDALDTSLLPDDRRPEVEALESALRETEGALGRVARFEALLAAGDLLGARNAARENATITDGAERESWRAHADDLAARVRREWRLVVVEGQEAERIGIEDDRHLCSESATMMTLASDGESVLYARICGRWIFLRAIDVAANRVTRAVALRAPVALDETASIGIEDGTAIVASGDCRLVEIDIADWEIRRWHDFQGLFPQNHSIEDVTVTPGSRHVWVTVSRRYPSFRTETHVVDVEARRVARSLGDLAIRYDTVPSVSPRVAAVHWEHCEITLMDERGRVESRTRVPSVSEIHVLAPFAGTGRYALCVTLDDDFEDDAIADGAIDGNETDELTLYVISWAPGEKAGRPFPLRDSDFERPASAAWSEAAGLLFVTYVEDADTAHLSALRPDGDGFAEAYRIPLPNSHKLICDARGQHVALVTSCVDGVQITALGGSAPDAALPGAGAGREAHLNLQLFGCSWPPEAISARTQVLYDMLDAATPDNRTQLVNDHLERHADDPVLVVAMARALGYLNERKRGRALERYLNACEELGLCAAQLAVLQAQSEALHMKWKEARRTLEAISPAELDGMNLQHYRHLLGAARYLDGDVPGARAIWTEMAGADDACLDAARLLALVAPLPDADAETEPPSSAALRLRCAIRDADAASARGDVAAAVRILDQPMVFCEGEAQSFGRLAAAYLDLPCETSGATFRKALVLAECAAGRWIDEYRYRLELQLEEAQWNRERLEQVKEKAAAWVEAWRRPEGDR